MKEEGKLDKFGRPNENTPKGWNPTKNLVEEENTLKRKKSIDNKSDDDKKEKKKKSKDKKKKKYDEDGDVEMEWLLFIIGVIIKKLI